MPKKSGLPKGVTEFQDRHGKWHLRYRAKGQPTYYFKTRPGQGGFWEEYEQAKAGKPDAPAPRTGHASIWAMSHYRKFIFSNATRRVCYSQSVGDHHRRQNAAAMPVGASSFDSSHAVRCHN